MSSGYLCFDLETSGLFSESGVAPSVYCGATLRLCVSDVESGSCVCTECPRKWWGGVAGESMCVAELVAMVDYIYESWKVDGYVPLTWNGAGFDFRVLYSLLDGEACAKKVRALALAHVDLCFSFFMGKGFPVKMSSVACAFACMGKTGSGAIVPEEWASKDLARCEAIVNYCAADVCVLASVFSCVLANSCVKWVTKKGKHTSWKPKKQGEILASVSALRKRKQPDNSWFDKDPQKRPMKENFVSWLN